MLYQVLERAREGTSYWHVSLGLGGIPAELHDQTVVTIREANGRLGWTKYMIIGDNLGYEACLRADEDDRARMGVRRVR